MAITPYSGTFPNRLSAGDNEAYATDVYNYLNYIDGAFTTTVNITEANINAKEASVVAKEAIVVAKEALMSPHYTAIDAVYANETNINAVNANSANITAVAGNATNINAVYANATNINTVASNEADIDSVVKDIIPNLPEILMADTNAATASAAAAIAIAAVNYKGDWVAGYQTTGYSLGMSVSYTDGYNYTSKINNNLAVPTTKTNTAEWNWIEAIDPSTVYTKAELDAGQLDNRYYTEAEANSTFLAKAGGSLLGSVNTARATVASHATTADIWGASGNQIDWTGTATTTIFPNAPQAGAERTLICAGACSFTAGTNLLINGVTSGTTVACAAGDQVTVTAISTTQFRLNIIKVAGVQDKLVSGTNIKTVGGTTLLGSGDLAIASGFTNIAVFTTSGTWTIPAGITRCCVTVVGGGGGGGYGSSSKGGEGGGGGGTAIKFISGLTPLGTKAVTIGAGGVGGSGADLQGGTGGTSSFASDCSATGGGGGSRASTPTDSNIGGIGTNGNINLRGARGGFGTQDTTSTGGGGTGGYGGHSATIAGAGIGGIYYNVVHYAGSAGLPNTGGGGGGATTDPGYAGGSGIVIIYY